ncbi:MAG: DUF1326 domain-containing protein [Acidobacteriota bacterium]
MAQSATTPTTQKPYRIKVHNLECCNCNHGCNCQFGGFPDDGHCEAILAYEVIDGHYGDVDLKGTKALIGVQWPKAIHEGHGKAVLFVDEAARPEQVEGIAMILSGQAGGMPWEAIAQTLDSVEGPVLKAIEIKADGRRSSFRIPGIVDVKFTPLHDMISGEEKEVHIVYPRGGFIWDDGDVGTTETMHIEHGDMKIEFPGRFAAYATPEWTNQK